MFSSLRTRLWLTYAFQIVAALTLVFVLLMVTILRSPLLYRGTLERLQATAEMVALRYPESQNAESARVVLRRLAERLQVRVLILDADNQPLFDSSPQEPALRGLDTLSLAARRLPALRDEHGQRWLFALRLLPGGQERVLVATPFPMLAAIHNLGQDLLQPIVRVGILSLLISLAVAWLVARGIADPLQGMVQAAQSFPENPPSALKERGPREVREVIHAFNAMAARVQASQQAQRDFVANVSHELKTPLTSIQGFSQAMLDGTADDPQTIRQAAEIIHAEAARMYRMVLDLLDLARMDAGIARFAVQPLDLRPVLENVLEKMQPQSAAAGVTLSLSAETLPVISGDGDRLAQVFTNLVDNAIKHTPPGGAVRIAAYADADALVVEVQDNGTGIPETALPHIFERFYRADSARQGGDRQGAGLGLAIAHDIVQAHGGKIEVRSAAGQGSTFIVRLPFSAPDASTLISRGRV